MSLNLVVYFFFQFPHEFIETQHSEYEYSERKGKLKPIFKEYKELETNRIKGSISLTFKTKVFLTFIDKLTQALNKCKTSRKFFVFFFTELNSAMMTSEKPQKS